MAHLLKEHQFEILMMVGLYETAVIQAFAEDNSINKLYLLPKTWTLLYDSGIIKKQFDGL